MLKRNGISCHEWKEEKRGGRVYFLVSFSDKSIATLFYYSWAIYRWCKTKTLFYNCNHFWFCHFCIHTNISFSFFFFSEHLFQLFAPQNFFSGADSQPDILRSLCNPLIIVNKTKQARGMDRNLFYPRRGLTRFDKKKYK